MKRSSFEINYRLLAKSVFFAFLSLVLLSNIVVSQTTHPLYFQIINDDKKAVVEFLKKIKPIAEFPYFFEMSKKIYGEEIEKDVFAETWERKAMIIKLEQLLVKNPKARDVLYGLYLLYHKEGNKIKANEYLDKAKEIDPSL